MKTFIELLMTEAKRSSFMTSNPAVKDFVVLMHDRNASEKDKLNALKSLYNKLLPTLETIKKHFEKLVTGLMGVKGLSHTHVKFLSDIKSSNSLISKIIERGKDIREVGDLVRGALLFEFVADVETFVNNMRRKESSIILDYESKDKGYDNTFGYYGSHHFDLNIDGLVTELQVMTKKLWKHKEIAEKIYATYRDIIPKGGSVPEHAKKLSKAIFARGNMNKESVETNIIGDEDFDIDNGDIDVTMVTRCLENVIREKHCK